MAQLLQRHYPIYRCFELFHLDRLNQVFTESGVDAAFDVAAWFAKLDEYLDEPFMPEGRQQPPMPPPRKLFE